MPIFCTKMEVWDKVYNQLVVIDGPRFEAPSWQLAEEIIENDGYRWLTITGELVSEIPCKNGSFEPDWQKQIDYKKIQQN